MVLDLIGPILKTKGAMVAFYKKSELIWLLKFTSMYIASYYNYKLKFQYYSLEVYTLVVSILAMCLRYRRAVV